MVGRVRVGAPRVAGASSGRAQQYPGTTSGYGATRGESVGYNPRNPQAYTATQAAKAYSTSDSTDVSKKA